MKELKVEYSYTREDYSKDELLKNDVNAKYHKSIISGYNGNPFIEALNRPTDQDSSEAFNYHENKITYDETKIPEYNKTDKKLLIGQLTDSFRYPLPFRYIFEDSLYHALVKSYALRKLYVNDYSVGKEILLCGDTISQNSSGFALLGHSGTGKSTAIQASLKNMPQVIRHNFDGTEIIQVTYLCVNCFQNDNLSKVFDGIIKELSKVVNDRHITELRTKSLPDKMEYICELIEKYCIGCIILDEIQLMDFSANKKGSYESLMVISNKTKVAIVVAGTSDAYFKMFDKFRTARRVGKIIDCNLYCQNQVYFESILTELSKYQWLNHKIEFKSEIVEAFYRNTGGVMDLIVSLFMALQVYLIENDEEETVTPKTIDKIAKMYYPGLSKLIQKGINEINHNQYAKLLSQGKELIEKELAAAEQNNIMDKILSSKEDQRKNNMINDAIKHITYLCDSVNEDDIREICINLLENPSYSGLDEKRFCQEVYKKYQNLLSYGIKKNKKNKQHVDADIFSIISTPDGIK